MVQNTITWILLYVLCSTFFRASQASEWAFQSQESSSFSDFPYGSETSCEGYPMMINCPGGDVIQMVYAEYGRKTPDICSGTASEVENTNCAWTGVLETVSNECNNKTHCTIETSDFPDPCPGTRKYLKTKFNCVRYLFNCPGALTGIGEELPSVIDITPQSATWTKDPLENVDHVFLATGGKVINEYESWSAFEQGTISNTYTLPHELAGGQFLVYDRSLYYFQENSHNLVRYSLRTRSVIKNVEVTDQNGGLTLTQNMSLAVDEQGLWVVYTRGNGAMAIRKLDKVRLSTIKTWVTGRRRSHYRYTFMICGVLYAVDRRSGKVEYSFNTNADTFKFRRLRLPFDKRGNNFLRYNPTVITYNPREQLLYSWDAAKGRAINYKLHFDGEEPTDAPKTPPSVISHSTVESTTSHKQSIIPSSSAAPTTTSTTEPTPPDNPGVPLPVEHCDSISSGGITWPETKANEVAVVECPSRSGKFGTWRCEWDSSTSATGWHESGPDLSKCNTWAAQIDQQFQSGVIAVSTAFEDLAEILDEGSGSSVSAPEITNLVERWLEHPTMPSQEEAKSVVKSITTICGNLLDDKNAMSTLSNDDKSKVAASLMNATEKASFLYADIIAQNPPEMWKSDSVVISTGDVMTEINVQERILNITKLTEMTSFPNEKTCEKSDSNCGNLIEIPTTEIISQRETGPAIVVFMLYNNLSQYLDSSPGREWEVDSRVISATLQQQNYMTSLQKPAVITLQHKQPSSAPRRCVFWDFQASEGKGNWSGRGCKLRSSNSSHTICECDHLTSFAVLVNHVGVESNEEQNKALDIITKVGISISIVCFILCIVTFAYFRNLHSDRTSVHKHLCICLLMAETVFLFGIDQTGNQIACSIIAGILHYFFLAAFLWMAVEGFLLYVMLVEVFESESRWKWYYLSAYGLPAVIVGISAAINRFGYGTETACWLSVDSGFIWSFVGPVLVIIIANLGFLAIAVYKMYVHTVAFADVGKINSIKASVRGASVLLFLLGITWAFGILWINENMAILAYLFCIFNAFQGMFIFIFHCLLPRKVRQEYRRFFSRLSCCEKFGQSSYLSNTSSFSKQFTPRRYPIATGLTDVTLQQSQLRRMWSETVVPRNSDDLITSEISTNGEHTHKVVPLNRNGLQHHTDRNYLQEDEVFLPPPSHDARNKLMLNRARNDVQYDRLQHHFHPEDYLIFPGEARPLGDFGTGKVPQRDHFGHIIESEHQTPRMGIKNLTQKPIIAGNIRDIVAGDPHNSRNRTSRTIVQNHAHPFRRSLDENFNGKRDSGIVLQRHPSLSGMPSHHKPYQRSLDNVLVDLHTNESDLAINTDSSTTTRLHRLSLDNIQRSSYTTANYRMSPPKTCAQSPKRTNCHLRAMVPPRNIRRKSLSSDSDDPIVTDCSVSSACSSTGNQAPLQTLSKSNNSKYEEPMCCQSHRHGMAGKRCQDRRRCRYSDPTDENDLEVELITNFDAGGGIRRDTLGHPPYRPPTPPTSTNPPIATPRTRLNQRSDLYEPHEFHPRSQCFGVLHPHNAHPRAITGL